MGIFVEWPAHLLIVGGGGVSVTHNHTITNMEHISEHNIKDTVHAVV